MRLLGALAVLLAIVVAASGCSSSSGDSPADPDATAWELVGRYLDLVQAKDVDGLREFLAPEFQIVRANGDRFGKDAYLAQGLPDIEHPEIVELLATQSGDRLIVFWKLVVEQVMDGVVQPTGPAPRLTTFARVDGDWKLSSHANFGAVSR